MNEKFLDALLSDACPANVEGHTVTVYIQTHCVTYEVQAIRNCQDQWQDVGLWAVVSFKTLEEV